MTTSLNTIFDPFPNLCGARIILPKLTSLDAQVIFTLRTEDIANKYIQRPKYKSVKEAESFIQKNDNGIQSG